MTRAHPFSEAECRARCARLMRTLARMRLDGAVIRTPAARLYYTGFASSARLLLVDAGSGPRFLTDFRYVVAARRLLRWLPCGDCGRGDEAKRLLARLTRAWRRAGFEGSVSVSVHTAQRGTLQQIREWLDIEPAVAAQRSVKSPAEQAAIRRAVRTNDRLFAEVLRGVRPGDSERTIAAAVRQAAFRLGDGEAFDAVVCAGANAAECHHVPGEDPLLPGMPLLLDAGVKAGGYCSDLTRTRCCGRAPSRFREIARIVRDANRRAIGGLRPGMTGAEVDALARDFIARAGYGEAFGHSLGHALGLEVHETPSFSPACRTVIRPGMVLTVEPGIYLPGGLGVRIEDVVLVTRDGCEVLSRAPHGID